MFGDYKFSLFLVLLLALAYRVLWSFLFFDFLTTDEAYYGYWLKIVVEKGDFPIMTSGRHFYVPSEVLISWLPYIILKKLGFTETEAVFLSLRSTGILFSFLSSLSIYLILSLWCERKIALLVSMFPNVTFLDWTVQARGYGLFFLPVLLFYFLLRKNYFIAGIIGGINFWLIPLVIYFLPSIFLSFFLINREPKKIFVFGLAFVLGSLNLILYNLCNINVYKEFSRFKLTYIPTLDDLILHFLGYAEGWIHYQCGIDPFLLKIDKLSSLSDVLAFSSQNPLTFLTLIPYTLSVILSMFFAVLRRSRVAVIFLSSVLLIYIFSPHDRNMVFLLIPFLIVVGIGLEELRKFAEHRNIPKQLRFLLIYSLPIHYVFSAFVNLRDCSGYYMNFKDGVSVQVKNFSCIGKDDSEFMRLYEFLQDKGINMVFSDFIIAPIINAYFYPKILASPSLYVDIDWMPEITLHIYSKKESIRDGKEKIAFVLSHESFKKNYIFSQLDKILSQKGVDYMKKEIGNLVVYYDFSPAVLPDDIWYEDINRLRKCFYSSPLLFERYFFRCVKKVFD